jgi:bleomycin hydrolase
MKAKNQFVRGICIVGLILFSNNIIAQQNTLSFEVISDISTTSVKDQANTGTCWSFGTTSFFETELIRMGKGEFDLSEMFTVRCTYEDHASSYIRYHGKLNFSSGAEGWDMLNVIDKYGILPQKAYSGLKVNSQMHDHREMDKVLKAMADVFINERKLSTVWDNAISGVLDAYLGNLPSDFEYKGKTFTAKSFRDYLGIKTSDYMTFTSYTHHLYFTEFIFESPDNWSNGYVKNINPDDLIAVMENAVRNGYSVVWASDVSDNGFDHEKGLAIVPEKDWEDMTEDELAEAFIMPIKQKTITAEMRQSGYDNYETTDDHLMHIVGLVKDQNGTKYFKVKNSKGQEGNEYGGYLYASEAYVRLKTMTIMVHKDAVPVQIKSNFKN